MTLSGSIRWMALIASGLLLTGTLFGSTINVPSDYELIQDAIDAASSDDTVLVAPGTYSGSGNIDLDFSGKGIFMISEEGAGVTIIDCETMGRGVSFLGSETSGSVLRGFTITNGSPSDPDNPDGGGILCYDSSPVIEDCIISGCNADDIFASGGGMAITGNSFPRLTGVTFKFNMASELFGMGGAVIVGESSMPVFTDCNFSNNAAYCGGGIYLYLDSGVTLDACEFSGNNAWNSGGGIFSTLDSGVTMENCVMTGNSAVNAGGALYCNSDFDVIHCTIEGNSGMINGSGICVFDAVVNVMSSIVWNNFPDGIMVFPGAAVFVEQSDIEGGWEGTGNMDMDPLFRTDDFHLSGESPCIDVIEEPDTTFDFDGETRPQGGGADIGADEYALGGLVTGVSDYPSTISLGETLVFYVSVTNEGAEEKGFDKALIDVTGPASTSIMLYNGAEMEVAPRDMLGSNVSLYVPASAPLGVYRITFGIYLNDELISDSYFEVEVVSG